MSADLEPETLPLRPVDGLPRLLGGRLARFFLRLVSMEEQVPAALARMVTPTPGYFRRDRHVHPHVDAATYRLQVSGVQTPKTFDLATLQGLPATTRVCVQECAGNGNHIMGSAGLCGQAVWAGPSFDTILELCDGPGSATHFANHGLDTLGVLKRGYHYGLSLDELRRSRAIVALTMNGAPLSRRHGFPARLIVPQIYSMSHVKWLAHIEGKTTPHMGIHNRLVFTNKALQAGKWVRVQARWIGLKSVILDCHRDGTGWRLTGCAWGGDRPISTVEVSCDAGVSWQPAQVLSPAAYFAEHPELRPSASELATTDLAGAWSVFTYHWQPQGPGKFRIGSRAIDERGEVQQLDNDPNVRGHFNQTRVKWRDVQIPERRLPATPATPALR